MAGVPARSVFRTLAQVTLLAPVSPSWWRDNPDVLSDSDRIRLRPGLFIGSTGERGMHRLVTILVLNGVDEALAGHNDRVDVTLSPDNSVRVADRGRGISVDHVSGTNIPAATAVLTQLPPVALRETSEAEVARAARDCVVIVNALSARATLEVKRDGTLYRQVFERGEPLTSLVAAGKCGSETGTAVTFLPDPEIFDATQWSREILQDELSAAADGAPEVSIGLTDLRDGEWSRVYGRNPPDQRGS
jgi:DNA gyrase subunit B